MKKICLFGAVVALAAISQLSAAEQTQIDRATGKAEQFLTMQQKGIPPTVLSEARGVAIIPMVKGGLFWSGHVGDGVVVARVKDGFSGPSFIHAFGPGFPQQQHGEKLTDYVLILNTPAAVKAFSKGENVEIGSTGSTLSAATGPSDSLAEAGTLPKTDVYIYSRSRGFFTGSSLVGTTITTNRFANVRYYQEQVSPHQILSARVRPPGGTWRHAF